jgi:PhnB protein
MPFHPYIAYAGNCREAFTRYEEIFGGELVIMSMTDMPADERPPGVDADLVIHAQLSSDGQSLMGADDMSGQFDGNNQGMCTTYSVAEVDEAKRVWEALSESGAVQMPLGETFFSPAFGMCTDRFGAPWMVVTDMPEPAA